MGGRFGMVDALKLSAIFTRIFFTNSLSEPHVGSQSARVALRGHVP
jgi:hypothetical protein